MARKLRLEYAGAIYHLMSRGDRREPIFKDDSDRDRFLETLGEACLKTGWQVHAYCLMPNHFHLVVETPQANLVAGMKWFLGVYTSRFNRRHKLFGHLFSGRYKSLIVDGSGNGYLKTVCDYVHLNPVRAGLIGTDRRLETYRWSSYPLYLQAPSRRPPWLRTERLFGEWSVAADRASGRRMFAARMQARRKWGRDRRKALAVPATQKAGPNLLDLGKPLGASRPAWARWPTQSLSSDMGNVKVRPAGSSQASPSAFLKTRTSLRPPSL